MTVLFTHEECLAHREPPGHPEQAARLVAVARALEGVPLDRRNAPLAARDELLRCHPEAYVARVERAVPGSGWAQLDGDTYLAPGSLTAALRAVGGVCAAVDAVLAGEDRTAFVACRPPGHHAEAARAMGFCLFGSVAIGAKRALDHHGLARVAVLDFDVHHGNGTQDLLWNEGRAMFVSSHQMPLYPGSGAASEVGAQGQVINLPLRPGSGGAEMRAAWQGALARVEAFAPQLVLVSAGFDAHADDPLAGLDWQVADFAWLTGAICDLADRCCGGRVVSVLEGGYDLAALAACVAAHVDVLRRDR
ncbi:Acetoin utilization deacetylase AcuC [Gemmobacter aquatilis]|uniref:Acetoin utilization deacetylase AcuC n=1 Tax=Gemmobacter aquatilis TaxID=933059 RepID=A0A1H7ZNC3_9RHOB|nr:histone deacetylase family protein [Gemmobacter aquatilis]SEM59890.1 Acetoin utilization deacetylase AcuC [Gemmobacter aquatilis]